MPGCLTDELRSSRRGSPSRPRWKGCGIARTLRVAACVANDRLRHRRIGNASVSKVDGSQSLDLQSGVSFLWTPVQLLTASTLHPRNRSNPWQTHKYSRVPSSRYLRCSRHLCISNSQFSRCIQGRGHDGQVKQGEQEVLHARGRCQVDEKLID